MAIVLLKHPIMILSEDTSPKAWISSLQMAGSGIDSCDGLNNCQAFSTTSPSFLELQQCDRFVHYVSKEEKKSCL